MLCLSYPRFTACCFVPVDKSPNTKEDKTLAMAEDQDNDSGSSRMFDFDNVEVVDAAYLAVRFAIAILVVWFASGVSR